MKLIVFSSHNSFHSEPRQVVKMFEHGLETFHLRKPEFTTKNLADYLDLIPIKFHNRIVIHSHHKLAKKFDLKGVHFSRVHRNKKYNTKSKYLLFRLKFGNILITRSCHKIHKLEENPKRYAYVFLSPIYESISKDAHGGLFSERHLAKALATKKRKVFALGGVEKSKFKELKELGFEGVALLGAIWNTEQDPLSAFKEAQETIKNLDREKVLSY